MGFVPPAVPPKPSWMSHEDYREKILKPEMQMLKRMEKRTGIGGLFRAWFRDVTGRAT